MGARDLIIAAPAGSAQKAIGKHRSLAKVFLSGTRIYVCICMGAVADLVRIQHSARIWCDYRRDKYKTGGRHRPLPRDLFAHAASGYRSVCCDAVPLLSARRRLLWLPAIMTQKAGGWESARAAQWVHLPVICRSAMPTGANPARLRQTSRLWRATFAATLSCARQLQNTAISQFALFAC